MMKDYINLTDLTKIQLLQQMFGSIFHVASLLTSVNYQNICIKSNLDDQKSRNSNG